MHYEQNQIYHLFNQGNNKQPIFFERDNYLFFLRKMRKHLLPHATLLGYCLMPNHFHWLLIPTTEGLTPSRSIQPNKRLKGKQCGSSNGRHFENAFHLEEYQQKLSQQIGVLLSGYTKAVNKRYNRSGSLFRGKTKAKDGWINDFVTIQGKHSDFFFRPDNDYARICFKYIHNNPVEAGLSTTTIDWEFSSARDYAGVRNGSICNFALARSLALI